MAVREWDAMSLAERAAWYGQLRETDAEAGALYVEQAERCDTEGHTPLVLWSLIGRLLCGSCGRTLPVPAGEAAPALRTAAA